MGISAKIEINQYKVE